MPSLESYRKLCLARQTELRQALTGPSSQQAGLGLFLSQHAMLHSAKVAPGVPWSFEDAILDDLPEAQARRVLPGGEHSIAWLVWHMARLRGHHHEPVGRRRAADLAPGRLARSIEGHCL